MKDFPLLKKFAALLFLVGSVGRRLDRAVSPLAATIILIGVTLAAGLFVYAMFLRMVERETLDVQVDSINLIRTSSTTLFSIEVRNVGSLTIASITVTLYLESSTGSAPVAWVLSSGNVNLQTGQVWSCLSTSIPADAKKPDVGRYYPAKISVAGADGSSLDRTVMVLCSS